jgi:hypothetical protein
VPKRRLKYERLTDTSCILGNISGRRQLRRENVIQPFVLGPSPSELVAPYYYRNERVTYIPRPSPVVARIGHGKGNTSHREGTYSLTMGQAERPTYIQPSANMSNPSNTLGLFPAETPTLLQEQEMTALKTPPLPMILDPLPHRRNRLDRLRCHRTRAIIQRDTSSVGQ